VQYHGAKKQMKTTTDRLNKDSRPGEVWKVVSDIVSPKMAGGQVVENKDGGDLPEDEAAHLFNEFFVEKIETLSGRIPDTPGTDPLLGPRKKMTEKKLEFNLRTVSVAEVKKIILRLKNSKATGVDGIPTCVLKRGVEVLAHPITWIVNQSIISGTFPKGWKESIVVPVLKKGNQRMMKNYRPVSNLCTVSKVLETVVLRQLGGFF
jgi:hypothetical protein